MLKKSTIEEVISKDMAAIWSILNMDEKHQITDNFVIHNFKKNQIIYAEKDEPQFLWCLIKGKVKRFKNGIGGKQQILRLYRPIQYFGYRAWFAKEPYVASTMASEPSQVGCLPMTVVKRFHDCLLPTHQAVLDQYEKVKKLEEQSKELNKARTESEKKRADVMGDLAGDEFSKNAYR